MRRIHLDRPFIAGMISDQPPYKLGPQHSAFAQDLIAPTAVATQRHGWEYDGTTADVAANLVGVWRNKFILADETRTLTSANTATIYIHNASSAGTVVASLLGDLNRLPRCVYNDELIFCAQDGVEPIVRYSGAAFESDGDVTAATLTMGVSTLTATSGTWDAVVVPGAYVPVLPDALAESIPVIHARVIERISTTVVTVEGIKASATETTLGGATGTGTTFPCVTVYNAGTGSFDNANDEFDGTGTVWDGGDWGEVVSYSDALLTLPATGDARVHRIEQVSDATTLGLGVTAQTATNLNYAILRPCPFRDAQAHKGSFWGTGVAQFPNRVYVGPPGWNLSFPPGAPLPFDPSVPLSSENANDFLLDFIDVPSAYDGDVNVAILSSPNPLLVLKRSGVYGIYGAFPNFSTDKIADGAGCIDLRSAISGPNGQFWAGEDGIYAYVGGQVIDLTQGKINREWRSLTDGFRPPTDYCAIGESNDHLLVSIVTDQGATDRCYVYDLRAQAWISRFTNHKARYFFSSKVDGEASELYWVGDNDQGRVMKSSGALDLTGLAKDGDSTSPRLQAWTGEGMDGTESIDNDARLLDLSVSANVYDAGAAGSTQLAVSVVSGGSLEAEATTTKTLTDIESDAVDRVDRTRYRSVNAKGRLHQVRLDVDTLGTNTAATKVEIPEMSATIRDRRSRT